MSAINGIGPVQVIEYSRNNTDHSTAVTSCEKNRQKFEI